ncbi:transcription-repair coupling factor [Porphyromonas crevioricanis]|uniref:transcription-repair coupling factor n=1 Tax=Porphyromonas crevioricanis TaxID=393921 RepID=UPI0009DD4FE5|nr:transcription-repair coupling factor [Porphyromonas crevioricanis]
MMTELESFLHRYAKREIVAGIRKELDAGRSVNLRGLCGSSLATILASLSGSSTPLVCIMNDADTAGYLYADLTALFGSGRALFFPTSYKRAIKYGHIDPAAEVLRAEVLAFVAGKGNAVDSGQATGTGAASLPIIVTYPSALLEKVIDREKLEQEIYSLRKGESPGQEFLRDLLLEWGFERTDYVYEPGQFAIRGSIMDIFSYAGELPLRVDFFGDEIESIRIFEIESQLSVETVNEVTLMPDVGASDKARNSILELLPKDTVFLVNSYLHLSERIRQIYSDVPLIDDGEGFGSLEEMQSRLVVPETFEQQLAHFVQIRMGEESSPRLASFVLHVEPQPSLHKNFELLTKFLAQWKGQGYTVYLSTANELQAERIREILTERGSEDLMPIRLPLTLHEGFVDSDNATVLLTDHQIFDRYHKYNLKSDKVRSGKVTLSLKELNQFSPGDLIVHVDHGIGLFGGLINIEEGGVRKEVIKLIYQNDDVVFVNLHSLHKLSKYHGKESSQVRLSKVGSGAWQKLKDRTKKRVKDIARDLIRLYAARRETKGFAFSPDSTLQHELEAGFLYEDTPDQARATEEVKKDMERPYPMDRLVCGDVGFGKTEVAVRAAFKAANDRKQVAILVPTTVLAYQHYETFSQRFKDMPVRVDYLSRARSAKETKAILADLASGEIDVIIGTHRLVSQDVKFKDLGLLIIDEEQKFGVAVKEKLRKLQLNVDTLTMSATPIPRTLHFSLMGARDLSNINTPPPNRYPVETALVRFSPDIIREAINFEMSRSGQVFFVHNRIQNIQEIAELIRREVPDARVGIGHGQMKPAELETLLIDFNRHEYDVLLCTTIVENGIDVPNANTIIIDDAHRYGLSDLHQLRGRVGRSKRKAFCYLISPPLSSLTDEAGRRLQAIESFSDLGSGIRIALQDLDIRGAGNALGAEQSGFVADLGYEAYQKVFDEALSELKTDEFSDFFNKDESGQERATAEAFVAETQVETNLQLYFDAEYIPQDGERILLYRELDSLNTDEELNSFEQRLIDRFGPIPTEGKQLIAVPRLRRIGRSLGIEKIVLSQARMSLHLVTDPNSHYYQSQAFAKLLAYASTHTRRTEFKQVRGKRILSVSHIQSVDDAIACLHQVEQMSTQDIQSI